MHSAIPFYAFFMAGALGSPLKLLNRLPVRDIVMEEVAVTEVVTVTVFGQPPTSTTATSTSAIVKVHQAYSSGAYRHWHHTRPSVVPTGGVTPTALPSSTASPTPISTPVSFPSSSFTASSMSIPMSVDTPLPSPVSSSSEVVVVPTTSEAVVVPTSTSSAAAATTTSTSSDSSPLSGGVSLLTTVNKYRKLYSLPTLSWSSTLYNNALKTGTDDKGLIENHELNPGSFAQVITPGMSTAVGDLSGDTPFELSYAAWLCEVSSDPQLSVGGVNQCDLVQKVLHMVYGGTGHHDILNSKSYTQIGCAFAGNPAADPKSVYQGLWVCDLAF